MSYRISFVPKKTGNRIPPHGVDLVRQMFSSLSAFVDAGEEEEKKGEAHKLLNNIIGLIRHCSDNVIEQGNVRTICAPNEELKNLQSGILNHLQRIPVHQSAHGFVRGRDSRTCAQAHTVYWGSKASNLVILNMDAKNFFHSITSGVIKSALAAHGFSDKEINGILGSCTLKADQTLAVSVLDGLRRMAMRGGSGSDSSEMDSTQDKIGKFLMGEMEGNFLSPSAKKVAFAICQGFLSLGPGVNLTNRFLPQGCPTSPCLTNLVMKIVDIRLSAMARTFKGFYTRYADDFTVSWQVPTKGKIIDSMYRCSELVLKEFNIKLNRRKKRVMGKGRRQDIVGYCVNSGTPTISRRDRRRIRASVHNETVRGSKRFREGERKPAPHEDHTRLYPSPRRFSRLMGHIGRIQATHPQEADLYFRRMDEVMNRTERTVTSLRVENHEVEIEI